MLDCVDGASGARRRDGAGCVACGLPTAASFVTGSAASFSAASLARVRLVVRLVPLLMAMETRRA